MQGWQVDVEALNNELLSLATAPFDAHYLVAKYGFRRDAFPIYYMGEIEEARIAIFGYNPISDPLVDDFETALIYDLMARDPEAMASGDMDKAITTVINSYYSKYFDDDHMQRNVGSMLSDGNYVELRSRMITRTMYRQVLEVYLTSFVITHLLPYRSPRVYTKLYKGSIDEIIRKNWEITAKNLARADKLKLLHFSGKDVFKNAVLKSDNCVFPQECVEILSTRETGKVIHGELVLKVPPGEDGAGGSEFEVQYVVTNQIASKLSAVTKQTIAKLLEGTGIVTAV